MARIKSLRQIKHRKVKKLAKGYKFSATRRYKTAKEAILHAGQYAYAGRKQKKRNLRSLWIVRINAALRENGMKYSEFINKLKTNKVEVDRKILADIAVSDPDTFKEILSQLKWITK